MTQGTKLPLPYTLVHTLRGHQGTVTTVRFNSACFYPHTSDSFQLNHTTYYLNRIIFSGGNLYYLY
jgi:hypothetical protein